VRYAIGDWVILRDTVPPSMHRWYYKVPGRVARLHPHFGASYSVAFVLRGAIETVSVFSEDELEPYEPSGQDLAAWMIAELSR
jgi:hypothetical protein